MYFENVEISHTKYLKKLYISNTLLLYDDKN